MRALFAYSCCLFCSGLRTRKRVMAGSEYDTAADELTEPFPVSLMPQSAISVAYGYHINKYFPFNAVLGKISGILSGVV